MKSKFLILILLVVFMAFGVWGVCKLGNLFGWEWGAFLFDFTSNFMSSLLSSIIVAFFLYLAITRPDEKRGAEKKRAQALAMLKIEFETNLERAKHYQEALQNPANDLTPYYPLRFTRGAWNALKESGFLPQIEDIGFVYVLLRVNELITVANGSLSSVRRLKTDNRKIKLNRYAKKAMMECAQIEVYLVQILAKLDEMKLPEVSLDTAEVNSAISEDDMDDEDSN